MFFSPIPFVRFLACLLFGRIMSTWVSPNIVIWLLLLITIIVFALLYIWPRWLGFSYKIIIGFVISGILILLGILVKPKFQHFIPADNSSVVFEVTAKRLLKDTNVSQSVVFDCYTMEAGEAVFFKSVGYMRKDFVNDRILPGDRFLVESKLRAYRSTGNPYAFEYADYIAGREIYTSFYFDKNKALALEGTFNMMRYFLGIRDLAESHIKALSLPDKEFAIIAALLLGNKDYLDYDTKDAFSESGAMHILAVSGLHLGVLFVLLSSIIGPIRKSRVGVFKIVVMLFVLWLYAAVSGFSPSIVRACIMFTVFLIAKIVSRQYNVYHSLAIAAFIILIINPYAMEQVGFWLSFLAVTSIVYFFPLINGLFYFSKPWTRFVWGIISVSISAQIGTILLGVFTFGFFPTWFLASNILILPILPIVLISALLIVLTPVNGFIATILGGVLGDGLYYISEMTIFIRDLPYASFTGIHLSFYEMLTLYLLLTSLLVMRRAANSNWFITTLCISIIFLSINIIKTKHVISEEYFVVSNVFNNSLVIQSQGNSAVVHYNDSLAIKVIDYTVSPIVLAQDIDELEYNNINRSVLRSYETLEKRILLVNGAWDVNSALIRTKKVDIIIITNKTPSKTIQQLLKSDDVLTVFDSSFSRRQLNMYKNLLGKNTYVVSERGAFVIKDIM